MTNVTNLAPDGGWGWIIVVAYGMANIIIVPTLQSFGLIFKDKFKDMGMTATDASVIINLTSAIGMTFGIVNGPLQRNFGFRKIAFCGGCFFSVGLMLTSFANSFHQILFTYSIITSLGMGMCNSSFSLALNTYFKVRRNRAAGIAMTITGLGPILYPQLISHLLDVYGSHGCILINSAIAMHIIVASLLLQPVKWHALDDDNKITPGDNDMPNETDKNLSLDENNLTTIVNSKSTVTSFSRNASSWNISEEDENDYLDCTCFKQIVHETEIQSIYGYDLTSQMIYKSEGHLSSIPTKEEVSNLEAFQDNNHNENTLRSRTLSQTNVEQPKIKRWFETGSAETVNLGSSMKIFDEKEKNIKDRRFSRRLTQISLGIFNPEKRLLPKVFGEAAAPRTKNIITTDLYQFDETPERRGRLKTTLSRWGRKIVKFFDLDLLRDPIYVSMMIGMSIAIFAEINFSMLTPFILNDFNYTTDQIATIMSALATTDIIFRFLTPFVGDYFNQTPRCMYMLSLVLLIITRMSILAAGSYSSMLIIGLALGVAKGIRTVYMSLVIPSYIPLDKLPSASGIQMLTNGILLLTIGPLIGVIRDVTGSYRKCIIVINLITALTLVIWTIEMLYVRWKKKS